jgi:hypothetical protein
MQHPGNAGPGHYSLRDSAAGDFPMVQALAAKPQMGPSTPILTQ